MVKKILLWTVYVLLVGLLVFGATNRTSAKTDRGLLFGNLDEIIAARGQSNGSTEEYGESEAARHVENLEEQEWVTLSGQIKSFGSETLEIQTATAGILEIEGRTWRYVLESGYTPLKGNQVVLKGFYENGEFEAAVFQDLSSDSAIQIRDEYGKPMWGGGRNSWNN